jgi:hypothetical protein
MKGIVFNIFERFVQQTWSLDVWEEVLDSTELITKDPFVGPGDYPDADMFALVGTVCARFQLDVPTALRTFGRFAFAELSAATPQFVASFTHPKPFLMTLGDIVHRDVKKLYPAATPPEIDAIDTGPDRLRLVYASKRGLGELAHGLIEGVSDHFKTPCQVSVADRTPDNSRWVFDLDFAAQPSGVTG